MVLLQNTLQILSKCIFFEKSRGAIDSVKNTSLIWNLKHQEL